MTDFCTPAVTFCDRGIGYRGSKKNEIGMLTGLGKSGKYTLKSTSFHGEKRKAFHPCPTRPPRPSIPSRPSRPRRRRRHPSQTKPGVAATPSMPEKRSQWHLAQSHRPCRSGCLVAMKREDPGRPRSHRTSGLKSFGTGLTEHEPSFPLHDVTDLRLHGF